LTLWITYTYIYLRNVLLIYDFVKQKDHIGDYSLLASSFRVGLIVKKGTEYKFTYLLNHYLGSSIIFG